MEKFDIYKRNKQKTNRTHLRGTPMRKDDYRYVVQILIVNSNNELLIQQRQSNKPDFPNMWGFSASGSVISGETSQQGATRELQEELGVFHDFSLDSPFMSFTKHHYFIDYYFLKCDLNWDDITIQEKEVQAVKWVNEAECLEMLSNGEFIPYVFLPYLWKLFNSDATTL